MTALTKNGVRLTPPYHHYSPVNSSPKNVPFKISQEREGRENLSISHNYCATLQQKQKIKIPRAERSLRLEG